MAFIQSLQKIFAPRKRIIGATDLRRALANNEFVFYYQPEWDLKTGRVKGVEALMRWESPHGIVPPNDFIPILEETGLINEFTPFLLDQTLHDLKELHAHGFSDLFMSINISPVQLRDNALPEKIEKALSKYDISPDTLECELTEGRSLSKTGMELDILKTLSQKGIRISIDDFGSGNASFGYIKNLNSHKIKVDYEFIRDLFEKESNQTIMRTIIALGHALGMIVLAEGIEKPEQEKWLRENGCDDGQGFYLSRPLPLQMLISFLRTTATQSTTTKNAKKRKKA